MKMEISDVIKTNGKEIQISDSIRSAKIHVIEAHGKLISKPSGDSTHILRSYNGGNLKVAIWIDGDEVSRFTVAIPGKVESFQCTRTSDEEIFIEI